MKFGFICHFLEEATVKTERREARKKGRREREKTLYFIINIAFSLSTTGVRLNFALASPQIIRLFYQSKSINRNLISIDRIKGR